MLWCSPPLRNDEVELQNQTAQCSPSAGIVPAVEVVSQLARDRLQVHKVAEAAPGALTGLVPASRVRIQSQISGLVKRWINV